MASSAAKHEYGEGNSVVKPGSYNKCCGPCCNLAAHTYLYISLHPLNRGR